MKKLDGVQKVTELTLKRRESVRGKSETKV